jgi:hypothetical protein
LAETLHYKNLQPVNPEGAYEPVDVYDVVIEWDLPDRRIKALDKSAYEMCITEL